MLFRSSELIRQKEKHPYIVAFKEFEAKEKAFQETLKGEMAKLKPEGNADIFLKRHSRYKEPAVLHFPRCLSPLRAIYRLIYILKKSIRFYCG